MMEFLNCELHYWFFLNSVKLLSFEFLNIPIPLAIPSISFAFFLF